MGRGITEGVAGVGRRDEKQWPERRQNANSRMIGPLGSIAWHSYLNNIIISKDTEASEKQEQDEDYLRKAHMRRPDRRAG